MGKDDAFSRQAGEFYLMLVKPWRGLADSLTEERIDQDVLLGETEPMIRRLAVKSRKGPGWQ